VRNTKRVFDIFGRHTLDIVSAHPHHFEVSGTEVQHESILLEAQGNDIAAM
jgi:hypothetical protein